MDVFWHETTFAEYRIKAYWYHKLKDDDERMKWERERYFAAYIIMPHIDRKHTLRGLPDIIPLPWELKQKKSRKLSKKQIEKRKIELDAQIAAHKKIWAQITK